jgi:hypothetical protein
MLPRRRQCDSTSHELLCLSDLEGAAMGPPGGTEEVDGRTDELRWRADGHVCKSRTSPKILLVGVTRSSCSFS